MAERRYSLISDGHLLMKKSVNQERTAVVELRRSQVTNACRGLIGQDNDY